jgi:UTP--glucose-1-phosphate uridylyltransferase
MKPVRKAVVPVAGYGTRMYPASKAMKKELFPVVDRDGIARPAIQIILEEARASGIEEFCLVIRPDEEASFRSYFMDPLPAAWASKLHNSDGARRESERLRDLASRISFAPQREPRGFGHAVHCARAWVGGEPFLLMLGDHLYGSPTGTRCAAQLLEAQRRTGGNVLAVEAVAEESLHLVGAMRGTPLAGEEGLYRIDLFQEKPSVAFARGHLRTDGLPAGSYLGVFGLYALQPAIFEVLERQMADDRGEGGEIQLTCAMDALRARDGDFFACRIRGERYDIGVPNEYVRTIAAFSRAAPR